MLLFGANPNTPYKGLTPLGIASEFAKKEIVEVLLRANGINVNGVSGGKTPLSIALEIGNTDIAELLRNAGGREDLKEVTFSGALTNWLQGVGNFENIVEFFRI